MNPPPPSTSLIAQGFDPRVVVPANAVAGQPLVVAEAPGKTEAETGIVLHPEAEAGGLFTRLLARVGVTRDRMTLTNCVWSRPPGNELYDKDGYPLAYTREAIEYWKPYLHELIEELRPPVIIGLGRTALEVLTGFSDIGTTRGYVNLARITCGSVEGHTRRSHEDAASLHVPESPDLWQHGDCTEKVLGSVGSGYQAPPAGSEYDRQELNIPTLCTYHPQFLNYGNRHLSGVFIRDVLEGLEIAKNGWQPQRLHLKPTPTANEFAWFCANFNPDRHILTGDIETPNSRGLDEDTLEDELAKDKVQLDIDRMSFCYDTEIGGWSVPFEEPFITMARELVERAKKLRGWNWRLFDWPRLQQHGFKSDARVYDLLDCWRHLHRTLPASLAFVAPFYYNGPPWKHEAHTQPEFYSAQDSLMEHICGEGMERDLRNSGQWDVYERHVVDVLSLTEKMAQNGLPFDAVRAKEFERELEEKQRERLARLQELVPEELKPVKQKQGLKKPPKALEGVITRQFTVAYSDLSKDEKAALNGTGRDYGASDVVVVTRHALLKPFNPSSHPQVKALIRHFGHKAKTDRKTKKETSDDNTLKSLITSHLDSASVGDQVAVECYQIIRECRAIAKVLGTYVKGWRPGADGLIHATPGIWGDMFRISWRKPNLAATVADKKEIQIASGFRKCIACREDEVLIESDWRGMEAVLVAYFAKDEDYMRLARLGPHSYLASHFLGRPADLSWSNSDLYHYFQEIKEHNPQVYNDCKRCVHGIAYGMREFLMAELYEMTRRRASELIGLFFSLFPKVKRWQEQVIQTAWERCKLTNAWNYSMPLWDVYTWKQARYDRLRKLWVKYKTSGVLALTAKERKEIERIEQVGEDNVQSLCYDLGGEAKSALSFLPRDTGAAMLKDALLALENEYGLISDGTLRTCTHDSILGITSHARAEGVAQAMKTVMQRPQGRLEGLRIDVEIAYGKSWDKKAMSHRLPQLEMAHA